MAQVPTLLERLRVLIGDMDDDFNRHRHTDTYLKKVLRVVMEQDAGLATIGMGGSISSTGDSYIEYTITGLANAGLSLCSLAAAIQVFDSELRQYIADGGGIATAIGPNTIDEKTVLRAMADLLQASRADYRKALGDYKMGIVNVPVRIDLYATGVVD